MPSPSILSNEDNLLTTAFDFNKLSTDDIDYDQTLIDNLQSTSKDGNTK